MDILLNTFMVQECLMNKKITCPQKKLIVTYQFTS